MERSKKIINSDTLFINEKLGYIVLSSLVFFQIFFIVRIKKLLLFILYSLLLDPFGMFDPALNFTGNLVKNIILKCDGQTTKAKIIDEIHYMKNRTGISSSKSYSYLFKVDGKKYKSDSEDSIFKIGDIVQVKYLKIWPNVHKLLYVKK